jgi:hypothetical protein
MEHKYINTKKPSLKQLWMPNYSQPIYQKSEGSILLNGYVYPITYDRLLQAWKTPILIKKEVKFMSNPTCNHHKSKFEFGFDITYEHKYYYIFNFNKDKFIPVTVVNASRDIISIKDVCIIRNRSTKI